MSECICAFQWSAFFGGVLATFGVSAIATVLMLWSGIEFEVRK